METRKKWKKNEISEILALKQSGLKLLEIGLMFNKTPNSIRKALQRHSPMYIKAHSMKKKSPLTEVNNSFSNYITYKNAIEWATKHNVPNVSINNTSILNIMYINKFRRENGYVFFKVRDIGNTL